MCVQGVTSWFVFYLIKAKGVEDAAQVRTPRLLHGPKLCSVCMCEEKAEVGHSAAAPAHCTEG